MKDTQKPVIFQVVKGTQGYSLYLNNRRISGSKPWGGGDIVHTFTVPDPNDIEAVLNSEQEEQ